MGAPSPTLVSRFAEFYLRPVPPLFFWCILLGGLTIVAAWLIPVGPPRRTAG
jgi:hypothetical protein